MRQKLLSHPRLTVERRTGAEGPRNDPYSFEEYDVRTDQATVVLHQGLGCWIQVNGSERECFYGDRETTESQQAFARASGWTVQQIERIVRRASEAKWRCCPAGGHHETHSVDGYPGESLEVCVKCGKVVDSDFSESAVM